MPIDEYKNTFEHLTGLDLPRYMAELQADMQAARPMADFDINGVGIAGLCRKFGLESDFPGCYVLIDGERPAYVGISKIVLARLRQHVRGKTHFDASLAYRMAAHKRPHKHTRSKAMETKEFREHFDEARNYLRSLQVAFVKIPNPLVLYVFEPYCAMKFDTSQWNTFETH